MLIPHPLFPRCNKRFKEGKEHHYWTIVENKRVAGGKVLVFEDGELRLLPEQQP